MTTPVMSVSDFEALIGTHFDAQGLDSELVLDRVERLPTVAQFEQFSLMFSVADATPLDQGTYELIGGGHTLSLFIVPVAADGGGVEMQACFNILRADEPQER
jgi:hypothetical protein